MHEYCLCNYLNRICGYILSVLQVITQIADKHRRLPEVREHQDGTTNTSSLQRVMNTFEQDIQLLVGQVSPRIVFIS